jgi:hypothetical protein
VEEASHPRNTAFSSNSYFNRYIWNWHYTSIHTGQFEQACNKGGDSTYSSIVELSLPCAKEAWAFFNKRYCTGITSAGVVQAFVQE